MEEKKRATEQKVRQKEIESLNITIQIILAIEDCLKLVKQSVIKLNEEFIFHYRSFASANPAAKPLTQNKFPRLLLRLNVPYYTPFFKLSSALIRHLYITVTLYLSQLC